MVVTKVKYYEYDAQRDTTFMCKCSVIFDDCIVVHNVRLFNGKEGLYVVMPEKKDTKKQQCAEENNFRDDVFHPLKKEFSTYLNSVILEGFDRLRETGDYVFVPR